MAINQELIIKTKYLMPVEQIIDNAKLYLEKLRPRFESGEITFEQVNEELECYVLSFMEMEVWNEAETEMLLKSEAGKLVRIKDLVI